jgi:hypothetical protein
MRSLFPHDEFPNSEQVFLNLCYTGNMLADRTLWTRWAGLLQRWRVDGIVAYLLDAGGPLIVIAAQALYIGQPFIRQSMPDSSFQALVGLLEDQEEGQTFAAFLREGKTR